MKTLGKVFDAKKVKMIEKGETLTLTDNPKVKIRGDGFVEVLDGKDLVVIPEGKIQYIHVFGNGVE